MLRQGSGTIVNVSSFAAKVTPPREAIYAASKAAMNAFSEGLWHDLEGTGIHVAIVNPGPIDTEIWAKDDEPSGYRGPKYPTQVVVDAILDAVERRVHEVTVPRRNPQLVTARLLRLVAPSVLRRGMARMEPVKPEDIAAARRRALEGETPDE
jgi:short-subunit dehydrogenase